MTIDFYYHPGSAPSRAVLLVAQHLGVKLNEKYVNLEDGEHKSADFLKINPSGQVPAITDGEFNLAESRAIIQYLCNKYAPDSELYPKEPKKRAQVDRMLYFDCSALYANFVEYYRPLFLFGAPASEDKLKAFKDKLELLDKLIGQNKYVTGDDLTIADLSIFAGLSIFPIINFDYSEYPNLRRWYDDLMKEHPIISELNKKVTEGLAEFQQKIKKLISQQK